MKKDKEKIIKIYKYSLYVLVIVLIAGLLLPEKYINISLPSALWPIPIGIYFLASSVVGLLTNTFHFIRLYIDLEDNLILAKILNLIVCLFSIALIIYGFIMFWSDSV